MSWPDGFLLVDKPAGLTSRDVVVRVQRALGPGPGRRRGVPRFRCGHAGTLDPMATGLLLVLVGAGTRLSHFLLGHDKVYEAVVRFGQATDTLDAEGVVLTSAPPRITMDRFDAAAAARVGRQLQAPPLVSAIKRDGRALHRRVRAGENPTPPEPRPVRIEDIERTGDPVPGTASDTLDVPLRVHCGSGTYIRSLARDLGEDLGVPAHLAALRRIRVGAFDVADALAPGELEDPSCLRAALRPLGAALPEAPTITIDDDEAALIRNGRQPAADRLEQGGVVPAPVAPGREPLWVMVDRAGGLVAVGRLGPGSSNSDGPLRPRIAAVFAAGGDPSCS